jgi:hypothetical protein
MASTAPASWAGKRSAAKRGRICWGEFAYGVLTCERLSGVEAQLHLEPPGVSVSFPP